MRTENRTARNYAGIMDAELNALTDVYLRRPPSQSSGDFWAWEEVERRVRVSLAQGWEVIQALVEKADAENSLGYVAAGPLEDFVDIYGDAGLDVIAATCETDEKMQFALSGIWLLPESPVLMRWRGLMKRYGFMDGPRKPLSWHPDCWF